MKSEKLDVQIGRSTRQIIKIKRTVVCNGIAIKMSNLNPVKQLQFVQFSAVNTKLMLGEYIVDRATF